MTTTKLNKGYYEVKNNNNVFRLVCQNTDVKEPIFWTIQTIGGLGNFRDLDIEFSTKKECLQYIQNY